MSTIQRFSLSQEALCSKQGAAGVAAVAMRGRDMVADKAGGKRAGAELASVAVWVFDLDNTLYPPSCNLFALIEQRMVEFIARHLGASRADSDRLRKQFFMAYGTTLRGLMLEHGVEPEAFLEYVHDIDLSSVQPSPALGRALAALPGRKLVFTNASRGHADRVMARLGVTDCFESVFDIALSGYRPKPDPVSYAALIARHGIDPARTCLIDDMARNLTPAAQFGMTTVWSRSDSVWALPAPEDIPHIHHIAENITTWLEGVLAQRNS